MDEAKPRRPRGLIPDGTKIKSLREKQGKTQDELLKDDQAAVSKRTYQRAEQGIRISRTNLEGIASLLRVECSELIGGHQVAEDDHVRPMVSDNDYVRLKRFPPQSGSKLFMMLRKDADELVIDFDCEPDAAEADNLAVICEFLETICNSSEAPSEEEMYNDPYFKAAKKVVALGKLNSALASLEDSKIRLYCGVFLTWTIADKSASLFESYPTIQIPWQYSLARIVFSSQEGEYIRWDKGSTIQLKEIISMAIQSNLQQNIRPSYVLKVVQVNGGEWWTENEELSAIVPLYQKAFIDRFGEEHADYFEIQSIQPDVEKRT